MHYQEGDIVKYVRNGDIVQSSVHYFINTRVCQGTYFATFASQSDMKRRIVMYSI
jgi:hypothetical protein